jgi:hypothetical protein
VIDRGWITPSLFHPRGVQPLLLRRCLPMMIDMAMDCSGTSKPSMESSAATTIDGPRTRVICAVFDANGRASAFARGSANIQKSRDLAAIKDQTCKLTG